MLVRLTRRATANPVPMDLSDVPNYSTLSAIGFGDIDPRPEVEFVDFPLRLQDVEVNFVSRAKCSDDYKEDVVNGIEGRYITDNMMCAAEPGKDSCQGDSVRDSRFAIY